MSERGTRLMAKADGQLSEMIEFFGTLNEVDLHKPHPDESLGWPLPFRLPVAGDPRTYPSACKNLPRKW